MDADTPAPVAQPLSAEEELAIRYGLATGSLEFTDPIIAARLLATLDAARETARGLTHAISQHMELDAACSVPDNAAPVGQGEGACICTPDQYQGSGHGRNCPEYRAVPAIAAAPASPAGLDVEDLRARITTNFNVSQRRVERGIGSDFDRGKAAGLRLVLSMLEPRGEPTFSCGRTARLQSEASEAPFDARVEFCAHGVSEREECPECGHGWTPAPIQAKP